MLAFQTRPYMLRPKEGEFCCLYGIKVLLRATSTQTGGAFNLFEVTCPPGFNTPLHIHYSEDVAIYVIEGALAFFWGSEKKKASAGAYLFTPRCIPEGFRVDGPIPARILCLTIPAGLDRFMVEQDRSASKIEPEISLARYKIEVLGPLPE